MLTDCYNRKVDAKDKVVLYIPAGMYEAEVIEIRESPVIVPPGEKPQPPMKAIVLAVSHGIGPYPGNIARCPDIVLTLKAGQKKTEELPTGEEAPPTPPPPSLIQP
jgi:hypothetical protein